MGKHLHRMVEINEDGTGTCKYCGPVEWVIYNKTMRGCPGSLRTQKEHTDKTRKGAHGLTDFEARNMRAGSPCGICGKVCPDDGGKWTFAVDHDHATGELRGVLCTLHNNWLGILENEQFVRSALAYLEHYNTKTILRIVEDG